ncbi:hypothetical protein J437_LFUL008803 [Ladona fulva]|uniref:Uncharacterized protein n=1 Tax=Ladona fulva TaxID=123851 RepID=A0A8K0NZ65_LADFU|nr:hypothetical protein J437_LFUL008803 [Ladona fulva]
MVTNSLQLSFVHHRPVNPVYEMEMKARRHEQQSEDGPPFNFQGMLRKTTYCRASLKRGNPSDGQYNSYPTKSWDDRGGHNFNNNNSNFGRMDNSQANSYTPMRPRRNSDKWKQQEDAKVHQLAPGIVLEGQEEEL